MNAIKIVLGICCVLGLGNFKAARGQTTVKSADGIVTFYGIICGISTYKDSSMNLMYCAKDAQDMKAALLKSFNWKEGNITLLLNSEVTGQAIFNTISEVAQKADPDDLVLFYFSGHGGKAVDSGGYEESDGLDETLIDYEGMGILDDTLSTWFKGLPTSKYVVFVDTCFSGGQIKSLLPGPGSAESFTDAADGFGADFMLSKAQTDLDDLKHGVVITACDSDELSGETSEFENGVFTYFLTQSLSRPGDRNQNKWVSAEECYQYVSAPVTGAEADQHVQIYDSNSQGELEFFEVEETGNNLGGDATEALIVVATTPEANTSIDSSLGTVEVEFNKLFEPGVNFSLITLRDKDGKPVSQTAAISDVFLRINLQEALADSITYTVTVPAAAVVDAKGKGLSGDYTFSFTAGSVSDKAAGTSISGGGCSEFGLPVIALILWMGWSGVGLRR